MSKEYSVLHRNFFKRAEIRALTPDLKALVAVLVVECDSNVGCYLSDGASSGLSQEALAGGLADLARRRLVSVDQATGEFFLKGFFRDNTFKNEIRRRQALDDFARIESQELAAEVIAAVRQNPNCGLAPSVLEAALQKRQGVPPQEVDGGREDSAAAPAAPEDRSHGRSTAPENLHGVWHKGGKEAAEIQRLVELFGEEAVEQAACQLASPWLSAVRQALTPANTPVRRNQQEDLERRNQAVAKQFSERHFGRILDQAQGCAEVTA